ncbi:MAG: Xaa-Pro peptidase family protein [Desulfuromonadales bacterium]|nr:Xaa-Pro peptidase family protein [Desulfuromonadales bacterium]
MGSAEVLQRIDRLQKRLRQQELDGALILYPADLYYFSGTRQNAILWIPADNDPILMVRKSLLRARQESPVDDIRPFPRSKEFASIVGEGCCKIGLVEDVLLVPQLKFYARLLPQVEFVDISQINRELRSVKSPWELEQMFNSAKQLCAVFAQAPEFLNAGMSEIELAAEFELRLRRAGCETPVRMRSFGQESPGGMAVSGTSACAPGFVDGAATGYGLSSAFPGGSSRRPVETNSPILIDYTASFEGYIVDMTRIFAVGQIPEKAQRAFDVALEIQAYVADNLRPGQVCSELYDGACRLADKHGLLGNFMGVTGEQAKFVGHGIGLELDEFPVLAKGFDIPLLERQTIAVEPKFLLPGLGAVGIENTFAVGVDGGMRITLLKDDVVCV